ncbi:MAG: biotin synthase [Brachymonas sp.]
MSDTAESSWAASLDPVAAARWAQLAQALPQIPWLHEEVGLRLLERIDWVQLPPVATWCNWHQAQGGSALHHTLATRWPQAPCYAPTLGNHAPKITPNLGAIQAAFTAKNSENTQKNTPKHNASNANNAARHKSLEALHKGKNWLQHLLGGKAPAAQAAPTPLAVAPAPRSVQLLVANMLLHSSPNPGVLLQSWQQSLATGGVLFFSCLGPDTLRPLQRIYQRLGWPSPIQRLVDMHDLGDALVNTGLATPVMEMEQLTLTYSSPAALLQELRTLGRNLHPGRFPALRGRAWRAQLMAELEGLRAADGRIHLPIEIIYGHAFQTEPKQSASGESIVSLEQLRRNLPQP